MTARTLTKMSVEDLVARFEELAIAQGKEIDGSVKAYNRLYDRLEAIEQELKSRDGDARQALVRLHGHRNFQVRITAANATLVVAPEEAREELEIIANSKLTPHCYQAVGTLRDLDSGFYKPE